MRYRIAIMLWALLAPSLSLATTAWTLTPASPATKENQDKYRLQDSFFKSRPVGNAKLHPVTLDSDTLRQLPVGKTLQVPLPNGQLEHYTLRRRHHFSNGDIALEAASTDEPDRASLLLITLGQSHSFARVQTAGNKVFLLESQGSRAALALESEVTAKGTCATEPQKLKTQKLKTQEFETSAPLRDAFASEPVTIDLMALYTPAAQEAYGDGVLTHINHSVAVANSIFERSHLSLEVNILDYRLTELTATTLGQAFNEIDTWLRTDKQQLGSDLYASGVDIYMCSP